MLEGKLRKQKGNKINLFSCFAVIFAFSKSVDQFEKDINNKEKIKVTDFIFFILLYIKYSANPACKF